MNNITVSLEQAKRLKEWGAPQNTEFNWIIVDDGPQVFHNSKEFELSDYKFAIYKGCAAYTLSELLEWLGDDFNQIRNMHDDYRGRYAAYNYTDNRDEYAEAYGDTPLDAVFALCEAVKGGSSEPK